MRDSQISKRGNLDDMPNSGERGLVESTSSRMTEHQMEEWGCHSTVKKKKKKKKKKRRYRGKNGEEPEGKASQ